MINILWMIPINIPVIKIAGTIRIHNIRRMAFMAYSSAR